MKKSLTIILCLLASVIFSGCANQYIIGRMNNNEYIGALRNEDFVYSKIQLHNLNSNQICVGNVYTDNIKQEKDESGEKFINGISNLSCNDEKLLEINWRARSLSNWIGTGVDQFNNKYEFEVVDKKTFKGAANNNVKYTKNSYLELYKQLVKF